MKLLAELDSVTGIGLIERIRQGMGKPNRIYVKNYVPEETEDNQAVPDREKETSENQKSAVRENGSYDFGKAECNTSEKQKSTVPKNRSHDFGKSDTNNTNINNTNSSDTDFKSINPSIRNNARKIENCSERLDRMDEYRSLIAENIEYAALCYDYGQERSEEILELITETVCTTKSTLRIGGQDWSSETVKSRFLKLDMMHIQYVFECLDKNTTEIHNIRAYLLSTLYNAPITINSYYKARVNHDLYG